MSLRITQNISFYTEFVTNIFLNTGLFFELIHTEEETSQQKKEHETPWILKVEIDVYYLKEIFNTEYNILVGGIWDRQMKNRILALRT
jgi:hypothetical protein